MFGFQREHTSCVFGKLQRKPESESEVDDTKKAKTENGSGDSAVNGKSEVGISSKCNFMS